MQTRLVGATGMARELVRLISEHAKINIAVAWAGMTEPVGALLANKNKFESVLIGIDFASTDPCLIDKLQNVRNAYVAATNGGCFHPKIYYFETGQFAEAIVGSANMTTGGVGTNHEACLLLSGKTNDRIFCDLRRRLDSYAPLRRAITPDVAASYRRQALTASLERRPPRPRLPSDGKCWVQLNSELATMDWRTFVLKARRDTQHNFDKRMELLWRAQAMLAGVSSFSELTVAQWKALAGVIREKEKRQAGLEDMDWDWFGSMWGAGTFANRVGQRNSDLAAAIDSVPRHGIVTRDHFERFCKRFDRAFDGQKRTGGVPTASRLLAIKRPDSFVCVNGGNKGGLSKALAFSPSTLALDNYWERVIEPIRASPWYNEQDPDTADRGLWECRVAMLDTIYYAQAE